MNGTREPIRILHVDDDPGVAETTAAFLEREDDRFTVETATSASEGLDRLTDDVDCVVSDYDMPETNGIEFLDAVREAAPDLPFVLYTGKGSEEIASEAISAGVTDYLQKGTGSDQYTVLANRIGNAVDQYRSRSALEASQERLSRFIEQSPLGVVEWDDDFEVVRVNDAAEEILGYTEAELEGRSWDAIVPDSDQDDVDEIVSELLAASGGYHSVNENVRKDGERIVCEWHNRVVTDETDDTVAIFSQFQDITERTEREKRLRQTTARLEAVFENSPNMINVHDAAGNVMDPNPRLCDETGYDEDELAGMKVWELDRTVDPDEARRLWAEMEAGDRREWEGVYERRDGSTFPVEIHVGRLDLAGEARFVVISRDISERRERERELERYETVVENTEDGIYVFDADGRFEFVNRRVAEVSGIPRDAWIGRHVSVHADLGTLTEAEVATVEEKIAAIVRGDEDEVRVEVTPDVPTDLGVLELRLTSFRTESGADRAIGFSRDVTDRRRRERTVREFQRRTETLIRASTREEIAEVAVATARDVLGLRLSGVHLVDDEREVLEPIAVTDEIREQLGEAPAYERTAPSRETERVNWEIFERGETVVIEDTHEHDRIPASETPSRSGIVHPLGDHGLFITSSPDPHAFDDTDVALTEILAATVTAALDRTERERTLRDRARRLEIQKERLDEFAGIVSHDLRNPLNVAEGRLDLAREEAESEHLDAVERAHERMQVLIDDLLTLAREGTPVEEEEPVALADTVAACWRNVETGDATLETATDRTIRADGSRVQQLLENLVRNAVEHGGTDVTVRIGELDGGDGFYVADDGSGIPPERRERVFESGYSTSTAGTGFGLAIAKEIAEAHGWEIGVTVSAQGGARFEISGVAFVEA
jgi:PAS domain S-box-containing protein